MYRINLSELDNVPVDALCNFTTARCVNMKGESAFESIQRQVDDLLKTKNDLAWAEALFKEKGGTANKDARDGFYKSLIEQHRSIARLIEDIAVNNLALYKITGYPLASEKGVIVPPQGKAPTPKAVPNLDPTKLRLQVKAWRSNTARTLYIWEVSKDNIDYTPLPADLCISNPLVPGLELGVPYWFRVKYRNSQGEGLYSDPIKVIPSEAFAARARRRESKKGAPKAFDSGSEQQAAAAAGKTARSK